MPTRGIGSRGGKFYIGANGRPVYGVKGSGHKVAGAVTHGPHTQHPSGNGGLSHNHDTARHEASRKFVKEGKSIMEHYIANKRLIDAKREGKQRAKSRSGGGGGPRF